MRVTRLTTNLPVADIDEARGFYSDYLGLNVESLNLGWVARYVTPDGRSCVQLVTGDATSPEDSVLSVHVGDDVDEAYAEAQRRGYEIVHPLTDEPWGVRRFFGRPDGNVINIVSHRDLGVACALPPPLRLSRLGGVSPAPGGPGSAPNRRSEWSSLRCESRRNNLICNPFAT